MRRAPYVIYGCVALIVAFAACEPGELPMRFYREDFEQLCDGAPCGWVRTSGEADQATWVETIHPGEHALRLVGNVSVRGPGVTPETPAETSTLLLQISARCDLATSLQVQAVVVDAAGTMATLSAPVTVEEEWTELAVFNLEISEPSVTTATQVIAVGIVKTGVGVCEISELIIDEALLEPGC